MIIHAEEIFTVDRDMAVIDIRHTNEFSLETCPNERLPESLQAVHVARGLSKQDFGLFVTAINDSGAMIESFLMTSYMGGGRGVIMPSDAIVDSPGHHLTSELARKIASVHPEEVEQFGLGCLISAVKRQYPGIR